MKEGGRERPDEAKEALFVKLAKELEVKPASFLAADPDLRRSLTIAKLIIIRLFPPIPLELEAKMRRIWFAGLDAGVLKPEDEKDIVS